MDQPLSPAADRHECSIRELSLDWTCMERQIYQGRNREHVKRLFEAYQPTKSSSSSSPSENEVNLQILKPKQQAFVLITGPSGVGKTSLALTLKARMQQDAFGFFCQGKFDQLTNCMAAEFATAAPENNAYDPFVAAVTAWVHYVCQKEQSYIQAVKKSILMELDSTEIQVMEESILALQRITRRRSFANEAAPKKLSHWRGLKGIEAEKRYMHIFAKFIKAICSPDHPIVLFIEDLQWADRNSLELLQVLATTTNMTGLLLLCTLRADDALLMDSEALSTLAELKEKGVQITEIQLRNLSGMAINDLLSSILNLSPIETCAFSKLVHQQTNGNPFFIRQFLSVLWKDGLLYREKATDKFSWKEEEITLAFHSPQSVTSLLVKLMLQLTEHEQRILQLASCLGGTIHECLLLEVVVPCSGVRCALENLTDQGLINFDAINGTGQFLHDRIQEAAYSLIPESKRAAMHLEIGLRLWIWLKPCHREAHLFTIANQIIHGMHLLDDPVEKEELAAFMLRVGEKAALLSSFSAAAVYFDVGISLLERKHWKSQYQLSLLLYNAAIEVQYYSGNLARVDTLLEVIFKRAKSFDDKLRAHFIQIYSLGSRDDMAQALTRGLEVLKLLGESFPRNPSKFEAAFALSRCRWSLRRMSDDDIMRLPTMSNKHQLVVMRLLNTVFVFAWLKEELIPLMVFRMIEITTRHGMSSSSCLGFALLGYYLGRRGNVQEGYRYCHVGLLIMERQNAREWQARVALAVVGGVYFMKHPLKDLTKYLRDSHCAGLVSGDVHFAMVCASLQCRASFFASEPLASVREQLESYLRLCDRYAQQSVSMMLKHQLQVCMNLMGASANPLVLTGEIMDEQETIEALQGKHSISLAWLLLMKHMLAVYFHDVETATSISPVLRSMRSVIKKTGTVLPVVLHTHLFLEGLVAAALSHSSDKSQAVNCRKILENLVKERRSGHQNFDNKICLIEAEMAAARNDRVLALRKYRESIEAAQLAGFLNEQALACEKAGRVMMEWGDTSQAREYIVAARSLYQQWGAVAKVNQMDSYLRERQW